jgi:hypothetical protein
VPYGVLSRQFVKSHSDMRGGIDQMNAQGVPAPAHTAVLFPLLYCSFNVLDERQDCKRPEHKLRRNREEEEEGKDDGCAVVRFGGQKRGNCCKRPIAS